MCHLLHSSAVTTCSAVMESVGRRLVRFHVDDELFDNFRIDADGLNTVGRMGGNSYTRTRDRFDLDRPDLDAVMRELRRN